MASTDEREIEKYKKNRRKAENKNNFEEAIEDSNKIGELYAKQGNYEDAITEHERALELSEMLQNQKEESFAHRKIGECHLELENCTEAIHHTKKYLHLVKVLGSILEQQRAYTTLGRTYFKRAESVQDDLHDQDMFREAVRRAQNALELSLELCEQLQGTISSREYVEMKTISLLNLGLVVDIRGDDLKRCTNYMERALKLAQENGLHDVLFSIQFNLGGIYLRSQNLPQALHYFDGAAAAAEKTREKDSQVEALIQKTLILAQEGNYTEAKRSLKRAYKLGKRSKRREERSQKADQIRNIFRAVLRLDLHRNRLRTLASTDNNAKMKEYETLGDIAAGVGMFKSALSFYHKLSRCAELLQKAPAEMIPIYISLAQTYEDDKQYSKACEYYQKELVCQGGNPGQQFDSHINIARVQKLAGEVYDVVKESYISALKYAKEPSLKLRGLDLLAGIQEEFKKHADHQETLSRISDLRERYRLEEDLELSEEEDSQQRANDKDDDDDVDMDELDIDSEDEEEERDTSTAIPDIRVARQKRSLFAKANEKGERPLQVACIQGNLKKVQMLLRQGHPVNIQDNAGWSPLHEACNHGFLEIAQVLIEHGANVNYRGAEGVTPLHDAAGSGMVNVLQFLIHKAAANVHAKDDKGQTALDHLVDFVHRCTELSRDDLAEVRAAERMLRSAMGGNNPHMNHETIRRRPSPKTHDSDDQENQLPRLPSPPKRKTTKRRPIVEDSSQDSEIRNDSEDCLTSRVRKTSGARPSREVISDADEDSSDDEVQRPYLDSMSQDEPGGGAVAYQQAITNMRKSALSTQTWSQTQKERKQKRSSDPLPAMLDDEEVGDDWLVIDTPVGATKRKRADIDQIFRTSHTRGAAKAGATPSSKRVRRESEPSQRESRPSTTPEPVIHDDDLYALNDIMNYDLEESDSMIVIHSPQVRQVTDSSLRTNKSELQSKKRQQTLTNMGVSRSQDSGSNSMSEDVHSRRSGGHSAVSQQLPTGDHSVPSPAATQAPGRPTLVMRLRVKIQDRIILVPVLSNISDPTVSWLAQEASDRYYQLCNMRPILSLTTKDGALLSPNDQILFLLTNGEEVHAEVDSWDMTPLPKRYVDACKAAKTVVYCNIKSMLHTGAESNNLCLANLSLGTKQLLPISKALHGQSALKELHLKGNKLGDEGVQLVCKVLSSLPNLTVLDLSSSCLTGVSLQHLVGSVQQTTPHSAPALQCLETLDVSHNHLGDNCTSNLATLVKQLPALLTLRLAACGFTIKLFQQHRVALADAMQAHGLQRVDVSHNLLGSTGVELLMMCTKISTLYSLKLTGVINMFPSNQIDKHLETFLLRPETVIRELNLDGCFLSHDQVPQLARFVQHCPSLEMLSIGCNPKLDCQDVSELLESSAKSDDTRLQRFHAKGCGMQGSLVALIDAVSEQLSHPHPLSELLFTTCAPLSKVDADSLCDIWRGQWGEQSICTCTDSSVRLAVNN